MSKVSVFDQGWIDLVFEGRNKAYGAYQLRKDDGKTTIKAFFSGLGFIGMLVMIPFVMNSFKPVPDNVKNPEGILVVEPGVIPVEPTKPIKPPKPEPAAPAQKNPNKTVKFIQPVATSAPVDEPIATTKQVQETEISNVTNEGEDGRHEIIIGPSSPTGTPNGTGTAVTPSEPGSGVVEAFVDEMPQFPGGVDNFLKTVGNKFRVPQVDRELQLRVYVSFVVEPDGSMTNIKVGRDPGYNMAAEAERVLKSIKTKWKPGRKKGKTVRTAYSLPIVINVK